MAQNVWILPYTSEKRFLHRKEFWEFTYKNALPAAYIYEDIIREIFRRCFVFRQFCIAV